MLDPSTLKIIHRKAAELVGLAGFTPQDEEAIRQELIAHVLQSQSTFDPQRGIRPKFVKSIVERYVASMIRARRAIKRDHRGVGSLSTQVPVQGEETTALANVISQRELDARLNRQQRSETQIADLACDMAQLIATLPEPWQQLLELRKEYSMKEASRILQIPRTTLNGWMTQIRQQFEEAGFRSYF